MDYISWNDNLAKYFFNEDMADREVLLYTTKNLIENTGGTKESTNDFIKAVVNGPSWASGQGLCQKALKTYKDWRKKNLEYPPYIAYLILFVLAEDIEGEFDPRAYYPRLKKLLGEAPTSGMLPSFDKMWELWADLEKWSTEDKNEQLGRFSFRIRGKWCHVGCPLSQTLLSFEERQILPLIFDEAELDPTDCPPPEIIEKKLLRFGDNKLAKRTIKLLGKKEEEYQALKNALIELVLEELSSWDGTVPDISPASVPLPKKINTGIRLCFEIHHFARKINAYLRFKSNQPFPENDLNFFRHDHEKVLSCQAATLNWSTTFKLKNVTPLVQFDASTFNWRTSFKLIDSVNNWVARFKGSPIKIFVNGSMEILSGWVETQRMERGCEFYITAHNSQSEIIESWGRHSCEKFNKCSYEGLPEEWILYRCENVTKSCENIEILTLSSHLRFRLAGGIKLGYGNKYLIYGSPYIILENTEGNEVVKINSKIIKRETKGVPIWHLPPNLSTDTPVKIEVFRKSSEPLKTRTIYLIEPEIQDVSDKMPKINNKGEKVYDNNLESYMLGAMVYSTSKEKCDRFPHNLPFFLSSRIIFIGTRPGEIIDWPSEELPDEWEPVWAIAQKSRKRWCIQYCMGRELQPSKNKPNSPISNKRLVKKWKEVVWINRKINEEPKLPVLNLLWQEYMKVAENV